MITQSTEALYQRLITAPGLAGVLKMSAKGAVRHWTDIPKGQPALFLALVDLARAGDRGRPSAWHLTFRLYLFARGDAADGAAQALRDQLVEAVVAALKPEPASNRQTLSGAVADCWISDRIETDQGVLGEQAIAWIPITLITA